MKHPAAGLYALLVLGFVSAPAAAEPRVKAELKAQNTNGFARLVFDFAEAVSPQVKVSGGIVVVTTAKPIDLSPARVEKLPTELGAGYLAAARLDPDVRGMRFALARKLTVNTMEAGEKLFIDFLPETWTGMPPGLPQEVVDELARRALDAEKRVQMLGDRAKPVKQAIKVHVADAPTFTRIVFDTPEPVEITTKRNDTGLAVLFQGEVPIQFGDAKARLPAEVTDLIVDSVDGKTTVRLLMEPDVRIRTFREDQMFAVDLLTGKPQRGEKPSIVVPSEPDQPMPRRADAASSAPQPLPSVPARPAEPAAATPRPATPAPAVPAQAANPTVPPRAPATAPPAAANTSAAVAAKAENAPAPVAAKPESAPAPAPVAAAPANPGASTSAPSVDAARASPVAAPVARSAATTPGERPSGAVAAEFVRHGGLLKIRFPFVVPTTAAVFRRGENLWLIFDTDRPIDVAALRKDQSGTFREVRTSEDSNGVVVRMRLSRPWVIGAEAEGLAWSISLGDVVLEPTQPIASARQIIDSRSVLSLNLEGAHRVHLLQDPDSGDQLSIVTAPGPARGIARQQNYVEFSLLATTHGIVALPLADDVAVTLQNERVIVSRPIGLVLSAPGSGVVDSERRGAGRPPALDPQIWGYEQAAPFQKRLTELMQTAAETSDRNRQSSRLDVARFYLAQGFAAEARGVLDTIISEGVAADDAVPYLMRAIAWMNLGRSTEALKDLAHPVLAGSLDAAVLRGIVHSDEGRWREARENFTAASGVVGTLPIEMQRRAVLAAVRADVQVEDYPAAERTLAEFENMGIPRALEADVAVLTGRIAEGKGHSAEALAAYDAAARAEGGPAAAEARYRSIVLRHASGELNRDDAIHDLEGFTVMWRGDRTENEALAMLGRLYIDANRFRDGFRTLDAANIAHPTSETTRDLQQYMATAFADLFLDRRGDKLSALEALGIFYDYSALIPIGWRGDEMIRHMADRLISVDLLQQASELLQHQVDNRLKGAARAQVAAKLAMVQLKNRKPDLALRTLRGTRMAELPREVREQRLLLEARATSEAGRHDLALALVESLAGKDVDRLRADILWAAKRYGEAAQAIERAYGERWKTFAPLADNERYDILRAAVGYALADDVLSLDRFRSRYAAKMADGPDRGAFEAVSTSFGLSNVKFAEVARAVSTVDTLDRFLKDYRTRFGEDKAASEPATDSNAAPATAPAARAEVPAAAKTN